MEKGEKTISRFYRPYDIIPDLNVCLLEQGIMCMGPATVSGCGALCPQVGIGCRGCYGPLPGIEDQGARMVTAIGSIVDVSGKPGDNEEELAKKVDAAMDSIVDPAGTFYRFSMAHSLLRRAKINGNGKEAVT
jgi:F420-non-reducing hydrogenase small subunit